MRFKTVALAALSLLAAGHATRAGAGDRDSRDFFDQSLSGSALEISVPKPQRAPVPSSAQRDSAGVNGPLRVREAIAISVDDDCVVPIGGGKTCDLRESVKNVFVDSIAEGLGSLGRWSPRLVQRLLDKARGCSVQLSCNESIVEMGSAATHERRSIFLGFVKTHRITESAVTTLLRPRVVASGGCPEMLESYRRIYQEAAADASASGITEDWSLDLSIKKSTSMSSCI